MRYSYTTYKYTRPDLLSEGDYIIIKSELSSNPRFYPFNSNSFFEKFKGNLILYGLGIPLIFISHLIQNEVFQVISVIGGIILFFGALQIVPEIISYGVVMIRRRIYYKRLIDKIIKSEDYNQLKKLMK